MPKCKGNIMARSILFLPSSLWHMPGLKMLQNSSWVVRLATRQFFCVFIHTVDGLKLLAPITAVKHIATVLPNLVLVSVCKAIKTLSQKLQGQTLSPFLLYLCASPAPRSNQALCHSICKEGVLIQAPPI